MSLIATIPAANDSSLYPNVIQPAQEKPVPYYKKYIPLISSAGVLVVTTCLLAAKIFKSTPSLLPLFARFILETCSIIWLDDQINTFIKAYSDLKWTIRDKEWHTLVPTAAKVFMAATNLLITITLFTGSIISFCGYPQLMLSMSLSLRPLSMTTYFTGIGIDVYNFYKNNRVLAVLQGNDANDQKIIECFSAAIHSREVSVKPSDKAYIASRQTVRQLDWMSIDYYKGKNSFTKENLIESIGNLNTFTTNNLALIVLGRICMGISKAFPETLADMSGRWLMSALYTWNIAWYTWTLNEEERGQA